MQGKKTDRPSLIYKPYLPGNWYSGVAARRGLKILGYQLIFIFVYLFLGQILLFDVAWLRVLLNAVFVLAFAGLLYADGAKVGLDDVSFAEIALQRKESGKEITKAEVDRCYHPLKGVFTMAVGILPLLLIALVFALITREQVYRLGGLPSWLAGFERRADIGLALQYYHEAPQVGLEDVLRIIVRLSIFPFVNMVGTDSAGALHFLERLSPLLILVIPSGYPIGYLQGRRLRASVHGAISTNAVKRQKRDRREKRRREKQENRLV